MRKKIAICLAVMLASIGLVSFAAADIVEVTGTFTASGTISIAVNDTSPDFGTIEPGANSAVLFNVTNNGDIPVTVTQKTAVKDSGNLTIGTAGDLAQNEYSIEIQIGGIGDWYDLELAGREISSSLAAEAVETYSLRVTVSSSLTYETANEAFSADVEATETS